MFIEDKRVFHCLNHGRPVRSQDLRNAEEWSSSLKSIIWKPYVTEGRKWTKFHTFYISLSIWITLVSGNAQKNYLTECLCEFLENRRCISGINEFLSIQSVFCYVCWYFGTYTIYAKCFLSISQFNDSRRGEDHTVLEVAFARVPCNHATFRKYRTPW